MFSLTKIVSKAVKQKIAIGHFNVSNLEQLRAVISAAEKLATPVIIGVSENERDFIGVPQIVALIASYKKISKIPIFLNADHTHSLEKVKEAAEAGFDSIVFDASKLPLEENIAQTAAAVKTAKAINKNIVVEGELGYIGSGSELRKKIPEGAAIRPEDLTKPEDAVLFVRETRVDFFAPAVGNLHGMFANASEPRLDTERIREIKTAVKIPLVLHGGSGNTDKDFRAAVKAGVSIIHISTELRLAWRRELEKVFKEKPDEVVPYKLLDGALQMVQKVTEEKLKIFSRP